MIGELNPPNQPHVRRSSAVLLCGYHHICSEEIASDTPRFFIRKLKTRKKIKNKLRAIEARLHSKFLLKNTTHHIITCGVSLQVFLQLEILSEQRRKSKLCRTCFMTVPKTSVLTWLYWYFGDNLPDENKNNLIKLCQNLRTTSLVLNLPPGSYEKRSVFEKVVCILSAIH